MSAFYNEIDPYAAAWLRNLIKAGHIAPGIVDERSIEDICPDELVDYTQCHFFAGVGVWSYALRRAGWNDSRRVWTGSCPCQPFSSAGGGAGFADERHLWPAFHHLIREHADGCRRKKLRPPVILGEQVASKDADTWLDLVQTDMEALGYAFGALAFPSASVGAPHIRDRIYWLGNASGAGLEGHTGNGGATGWKGSGGSVTQASVLVRLADANPHGLGAHAKPELHHAQHNAQSCGTVFGLANAQHAGRDRQEGTSAQPRSDQSDEWLSDRDGAIDEQLRGPTNGIWRDADWLHCRDGKWRPVEPGTFPLADGATARVGRLRAYGNAINAEQARIFIESVMEVT
ncbi:DNA cytosine methyltransferase [Janthinobacterium rivuli]|uniref:DNA cytosine methyltransferase n=1 Tax=Janthinobacterium rivuli TaxID=2751478 RepID=A0ABY8IB85_9BURK|nr:DNA cytosine methyltransferase [Janthinobacterium rivuli]WFR81388.1 DNA cytosine methyltransferase [Janthinobacterium rivuli]